MTSQKDQSTESLVPIDVLNSSVRRDTTGQLD